MLRAIAVTIVVGLAAVGPAAAERAGHGHGGSTHTSGHHGGGHATRSHGGHRVSSHQSGHYDGRHHSGAHVSLAGFAFGLGHHHSQRYRRSYYYSDPYAYGAYGYGYGASRYAPRYGYYADADVEGGIRFSVEPARTAVYVDGYYAGIADDFDGPFQRLHLAPGRHEIALSLDGFATARFEVYANAGHILKLHHRMAGGGARGAVGSIRPLPYEGQDLARGADAYDETARSQATGVLLLEIRPSDAAVYVDGEFQGVAAELRRLDLPVGHHRVEIVRPGKRTLVRDVAITDRAAQIDAELVP